VTTSKAHSLTERSGKEIVTGALMKQCHPTVMVHVPEALLFEYHSKDFTLRKKSISIIMN
jgi:hypothetical protein